MASEGKANIKIGDEVFTDVDSIEVEDADNAGEFKRFSLGSGATAEVNGQVKTYKVASGASVAAGDFVSFSGDYGAGLIDQYAFYSDGSRLVRLDANTNALIYPRSDGYIYAVAITHGEDGSATVSDPAKIVSASAGVYSASSYQDSLKVCALRENLFIVGYNAYTESSSVEGIRLHAISYSNGEFNLVNSKSVGSSKYFHGGLYTWDICAINSTSFAVVTSTNSNDYKTVYLRRCSDSLLIYSPTLIINGVYSSSQLKIKIAKRKDGAILYVYTLGYTYAGVAYANDNGTFSVSTYGGYAAVSMNLASNLVLMGAEEQYMVLFGYTAAKKSSTSIYYNYYLYKLVMKVVNGTLVLVSYGDGGSWYETRYMHLIPVSDTEFWFLQSPVGGTQMIARRYIVTEESGALTQKGGFARSGTNLSFGMGFASDDGKILVPYVSGASYYGQLSYNGSSISLNEVPTVGAGVYVKPAETSIYPLGVAKTGGSDGSYVDVYVPYQRYAVVYSLTGLTSSGSVASIRYSKSGEDILVTTLAASTGYEMPEEIAVTIGGIPSTAFAYDPETGTVYISPTVVTGTVVITAVGVAKTYSVSLAGTGCTLTGDSTATYSKAYTATVSASPGYDISTSGITVTIGGAAYTGYTFTQSTGVLSIPGSAVAGDIAISVVGSLHEYTITLNLTNCTKVSGSETMNIDNPAHLTFTANDGYALPDEISVTGATYGWNQSTGELDLGWVSGQTPSDVAVTIVAEQTRISFSIDGTTYSANGGSTWAEWCADTSLNTDGFYVDEYVYASDGGEVVLSGGSLFGTSEIIDGAAYTTLEPESAVGTWLLSETLTSMPSSSTNYAVTGNSGYSAFTRITLADSGCTIRDSETYGTAYYKSSDTYSVSGDDVAYGEIGGLEEGSVSKTSDEGILYRTITITGGDDATNADFVAWLKLNATKQKYLIWEDADICTVKYNGTVLLNVLRTPLQAGTYTISTNSTGKNVRVDWTENGVSKGGDSYIDVSYTTNLSYIDENIVVSEPWDSDNEGTITLTIT